MPWFTGWMWPSAAVGAMDGTWLTLGPTLVKVLVLPAQDPHFFTLAVPGSHRAGPYDPGGAPYGRRGHGRFRRTDGRSARRGKGVKQNIN